MDRTSVVSLDDVTAVRRDDLGRLVGFLTPAQEEGLAAAVKAASDLAPWA